jgi:hypothetical protein
VDVVTAQSALVEMSQMDRAVQLSLVQENVSAQSAALWQRLGSVT